MTASAFEQSGGQKTLHRWPASSPSLFILKFRGTWKWQDVNSTVIYQLDHPMVYFSCHLPKNFIAMPLSPIGRRRRNGGRLLLKSVSSKQTQSDEEYALNWPKISESHYVIRSLEENNFLSDNDKLPCELKSACQILRLDSFSRLIWTAGRFMANCLWSELSVTLPVSFEGRISSSWGIPFSATLQQHPKMMVFTRIVDAFKVGSYPSAVTSRENDISE